MFSSASEVFINALCRVVTTYKIVVFKFQFVCPLKSKSINPRRKRLMPDAALEARIL